MVLSLIKLRCSLKTMQEHEALKGQLYIKMSVVDNGIVTEFWKSDRFMPTISTSFQPDSARVIAKNSHGLKDVSFVVKFVSKNKLGIFFFEMLSLLVIQHISIQITNL